MMTTMFFWQCSAICLAKSTGTGMYSRIDQLLIFGVHQVEQARHHLVRLGHFAVTHAVLEIPGVQLNGNASSSELDGTIWNCLESPKGVEYLFPWHRELVDEPIHNVELHRAKVHHVPPSLLLHIERSHSGDVQIGRASCR